MAAKRTTTGAKRPLRKGRRKKSEPDWRPRFLRAFENRMTVTAACEEVEVGRRTVYQERQKNEDFALAWADIQEKTTEAMEREAFRRGVEGVEKPIYQGKELVGHVREFSDTLLIFMLKSRRPDVYRDVHHVRHEGQVNHAHSLDLSKLSAQEIEELEQLARKAAP